MSGKSCEEALDRLFEYIDHELPDEELRRVDEHLHHCSDCETERRVNQRIKDMVADCPKEVAPDALREKVLALIAEARESG